MAFDMHAGSVHDEIDYAEEVILDLIDGDSDFPLLNWLSENFYNGPRIQPERARSIASELVTLRETLEDQDLRAVCSRLIQFFSGAAAKNIEIHCVSD